MAGDTSEPIPASTAYLRYKRLRRQRRLAIVMCQILLLIAFLAAWEILARTHVVNPFLTSYPSQLWPTFLDLLQNHQLLYHTWSTVRATLVGFAISMVLGIAIAAILWFSDFLYKVFDPFVTIANAMPKIALVPIFYIWLGANYSIYGIAVAVALFITIIVMYSGFRGIDENRIKLARTFGATRLQVLRLVVLPGSVPVLFSAIKMNIGLSLIGVIVGEFQAASSGLGFLIINGAQIFKLNIVMTAVVILAIISGIMYLIVARLEAAVARRYQ
ncbi:MAG: ABC transporter permease [Candidimonas sp.]|nr:MAG: ABC transporter permease [Candidimonas sp.]